jgi:hypothetical protein
MHNTTQCPAAEIRPLLLRIVRSEYQLQAELSLARHAGDATAPYYGSELIRRWIQRWDNTRGEDSATRRRKVWMVENIEELGAELKAEVFLDSRALHQTKVGVHVARADQVVSAQVTD